MSRRTRPLETLLFATLAMTMLAAACKPGPPYRLDDARASLGAKDSLIVRFLAGEKRPSGTASFAGRSELGQLGTYCWTSIGDGASVNTCADSIGPLPPEDPISVPAGSPILLDSDADAVHGTLSIHRDGIGTAAYERQKSLSDLRSASLDVPPGDFMIELVGRWSQGSAGIYFGIHVT